MSHRLASAVLALATVVAAQAVPAQPAPSAPACGNGAAPVYEPGCDGPGRLVCDGGVTLPATSVWCGCDGRTVTAPSMSPPQGLRYLFRGACEVPARFELTDERAAGGATTGRVVVFLAVGGTSTEATRVRGPCRPVRVQPGELSRIVCGPRDTTTITLRRTGDAVVASEGVRPLERIEVPAAQRVVAEAPRRF